MSYGNTARRDLRAELDNAPDEYPESWNAADSPPPDATDRNDFRQVSKPTDGESQPFETDSGGSVPILPMNVAAQALLASCGGAVVEAINAIIAAAQACSDGEAGDE